MAGASKPNEYPLVIDTLSSDCAIGNWYYSKGHHDKAAFLDKVNREYGVDFKPEDVEHRYGRWEFDNSCGEPGQILAAHSKPGPGIFPVTIIDP